MLRRIPAVAVLAWVAILCTFAPAAGADPSPTGREPRLLWTPERQAVWNRMKADYDRDRDSPQTLGGKWFKLVKDNAECGCRYGDSGQWATLMFQWTGDRKYVDLAWKQLSDFIKRPVAQTSGNYVREHGTELVVMLDWLWPALSAERRTELMNAIGAMLNNALTGNKSINGYRLNDSDQVVGQYFAIVLFHLVQPDHPLAKTAFAHPRNGGLDATAADRTTARNAIRSYLEQLAIGGEWIESAEYNLGTVNLLLMGAEAVRTATGQDHFPEVTRWLPLWGRRQIAFWTPDLAQAYQWGDEEHPRQVRHFAWTNASGLAAGLLQGTPEGAQLQQQLLELIEKYGAVGYATMEPIVAGRLFYAFNPYAPTADWRTARGFHAPGAGLTLYKSSFEPSGSMFAAHLAGRKARASVDHLVRYFNDFELWRKGQWVITHPRGYAGVSNGGLGTNAVLMHGFGDMSEFKELLGAAMGDDYAFQVGTTGGAAVAQDYYDPPPLFVHEWTRSVLYLPGATDTIVVHDRTHVGDALRRERYYAPERTRIDTAPAVKQWILHMPVQPQITASRISWRVGDESVTWTPLLPAGAIKTPYDEKALRKGGDPQWKSAITDAELKHHVRVWPSVKQNWDTFLNVIQVGSAVEPTLVRGKDDVEGVVVSNDDSDTVVLFNARPSGQLEPGHYRPSHEEALRRARIRSDGFTATWTSRAARTRVLLADLDPTVRWSIAIDGRPASRQGVADPDLLVFEVTGAGGHTLTATPMGPAVTAQGAPTAPAAPTGIRIVR